MTFTPHDISRLVLLRTMDAEFRRQDGEIKVAAEHLPKLDQTETAARDALCQFLPSEIVALHPDVLATGETLRQVEFQRSALREAHQRTATRQTVLKGNLARVFSEFLPRLREMVKAGFPAPTSSKGRVITNFGAGTSECAAALDEVCILRGKSPADRVESLLALCVRLGAELPAENLEAAA